MVDSHVTAITPATHADRHSVGGADPLVNPLVLHASRHIKGGIDEVAGVGDATINNVSGSRVIGTVYHNTDTNMMFVTVTADLTGNGSYLTVFVDVAAACTTSIARTINHDNCHKNIFFVVPAGYYYKVTKFGASASQQWFEYVL